MKYLVAAFFLALSVSSHAEHSNNSDSGRKTYVFGEIENVSDTDSISLFVFDKNFLSESETALLKPRLYKVSAKSTKFKFALTDIDGPCYFVLAKNGTLIYRLNLDQILINYFIMEPGDSINVNFSDNIIKFEGRGSDKYTCQYELQENYKQLETTFLKPNTVTAANYFKTVTDDYPIERKIVEAQLQVLEKYKGRLSKKLYQVLHAEIVGRYQEAAIEILRIALSMGWVTESEAKELEEYFKKFVLFCRETPDDLLALSKNYIAFLLRWHGLLYGLEYVQGNRRHYYADLKNDYHGFLRDKLLTTTIIRNFKYLPKADSLIKDALMVVENEHYSELLTNYDNANKIGKPAPPFSLTDAKGKIVSLSDFKGKVVFLDFWYTGCTPCAWYYHRSVSVAENHFRNSSKVKFITVSADKDRCKWLSSIKSGTYTSAEITNLSAGAIGKDHPIFEDYSVLGFPKPILIDQNGNIFSIYAPDLGAGSQSSPERLISTIESALSKAKK